VYSLLSSMWSFKPASSLSITGQLTGIFFCLCILLHSLKYVPTMKRSHWSQLVPHILLVAIFIALIEFAFSLPLSHAMYALLQHARDLELSTLNQGAFIVSLLLWPSIFVLKQYNLNKPAFGLWLVSAGALSFLDSLSAFSGFFIASCIYLATMIMRLDLLKKMMIAALPLYSLCLVSFLSLTDYQDYYGTKDQHAFQSAIHRLYIWKHSLNRISEKPLLGWGMNSARHMDQVPSALTEEEKTLPPHPLFKASIPLHPHNGFLQIWLELGIPGVLGYFLLYTFIGAAIFKISPNAAYRSAALAALASNFIIQQTAYGIWQQWMWAAIAWQAIIFINMARIEKSADKPT